MEGKPENEQTNPELPDLESSSNERRFVRRLLRVLFILFLLPFPLFFLFQVPSVQTWTVRQITKALSNQLNTQVKIDYFRLGFFNQLMLEGVYVEDLEGDTLLYSNGLQASISLSPLEIIRNGLIIHRLRLEDSQIFIRRDSTEFATNVNLLLAKLQKEESKEKKKKQLINIELDRIRTGKLRLVKLDSLKNQKLTLVLQSAVIKICDVDLATSMFNFESVKLVHPIVEIDDYKRTALWDSLLLLPRALKDTSQLKVKADQILIDGGVFNFHNYRKAPIKLTPDSILDYKHMAIQDIRMDFKNFEFHRDTFSSQVECFSLKDSSGFYLNDWSASEVIVHSQGVAINDMKFQTPHTILGDTLQLRYQTYEDFLYFPDNVIIDAKIEQSQIALRDIITFAPKLNENKFFQRNRGETVLVDGRLRGTVNNLDGRNLRFQLADGSVFQGRFDSRNLAVPGENYLDIRFQRLNTNVPTLRRWLPNLQLPSNFDRLGQLDFKGSVVILGSDIVTDGALATGIGDADLDIQLKNLAAGPTNTKYSGKIDLKNFNLGTWTGNSDYGLVSITSTVEDGVGLSGPNAFANFSANISTFVFRDYNYENAAITGGLKSQQFDGVFVIKDDNIDFGFQGKIDLAGETPAFDFTADIKKFDLEALNFSEKPFEITGLVNLNLRNKTIEDLAGTINLKDINIIKEGQEVHIDRIDVNSNLFDFGTKELRIESDILDAEINGVFSIDRVPSYFARYVQDEFPLFAHQIGINSSDTTNTPHEFRYSVNIKDTKGVQTLFVESFGDLKNASISGEFSNLDSLITTRIKIPEWQIGKMNIQALDAFLEMEKDEGDLNLHADGFSPGDKIKSAPLTLLSTFNQDTVFLGLTYDNKYEKAAINRLYFDANITALDSNRTLLRMEDSELIILDELWKINANNEILFSYDSILVDNFTAMQPNRTASLESFDKRGLMLSIVNLDFNGLNRQINYEPLQFDGNFNVFLQTRDITKLTDIRMKLNSDSLLINQDDWGSLDVVAQMDDAKQPILAFVSLTKDTSQLLLDAFYNVSEVGPRPDEQQGYFDANLSINSFPLTMAEYFIGGTISDVVGGVDAKLRFSGQPELPKVYGGVSLSPGGITLNYLKTRYTFGEEEILVDDYSFDASGTILYDMFGNPGTIEGGIRHNHLKDFGFGARLYSPRFQGLNTVKGDNNLFYGQGIGEIDIQFLGTFRQPNIYVNATVAQGTNIAIPVSSEKQASEFGFIRFVDKSKEDEEAERRRQDSLAYDLKGVSLDMDLNINNSAIMQIIFNEQAGDIIEGRGYGALSIAVPRDGNFKMFGDYTIDSGDYLFTLYNLVNKRFTIQRGGTISWNGDPFAAEIDIVAEYNQVNTSVANFIQEYLLGASADLQNQASEVTNVNLSMGLTGELLKPNIDFDIAFPILRGQLETYTDSKLRLLQMDQNELNKQVFGLIIAGQFLPADFNLQGTEIIYNTVGEFLSNQLSLLLTELLSEVIGEGKTLSSVDFDIALSQYQNVDLGAEQNANRGNELQVSLKQNFFNDRFSVKIGGNVDLDGSTQATSNMNTAFVGNDLIVEAIINEDRTLTMRVYQRSAPDIGGRKLEIGAGLSYRKEFNSFGEFLRSFKVQKNR